MNIWIDQKTYGIEILIKLLCQLSSMRVLVNKATFIYCGIVNRTLEWTHGPYQLLSYYNDVIMGVSNHQPQDCLLNRLFRCRSKKTSKFRVTELGWGIHQWQVNSPHKGPVMQKMFPFDDVIMNQWVLYEHKWYHVITVFIAAVWYIKSKATYSSKIDFSYTFSHGNMNSFVLQVEYILAESSNSWKNDEHFFHHFSYVIHLIHTLYRWVSARKT